MSVRFAPSPTGRFHIGNLRTAWVSYWWARELKQPWVVRFEDIDAPRVLPGAQQQQLQDLKTLGLNPDLVQTQSERLSRHWQLFVTAVRSGQAYPCSCSRKEWLENLASAPHGPESVYSGKCRTNYQPASDKPTIAWRFKENEISGRKDFIIARTSAHAARNPDELKASFTPSYHWACALDDYDGNHSLLVRAIDLELATPIQRSIMKWISEVEKRHFSFPAVFHTALIVQNDGHRLEKRTRGVTLSELFERGLRIQDIHDRFSRSFNAVSSDFRPSHVFAESVSLIRLKDLAF